MHVWIIMPTLNEAGGIEATLGALREQRHACPQVTLSIIIVDGGSRDDTVARSRELADHVISAPRGRARQMNRGAAWVREMTFVQPAGDNEVLLFLHADTRLPPGAPEMICSAIRHGALWGRFDVQLSGNKWLLRVVEFMMNLRSRLSGIATGDQAMFVRRDTFEQLGGFAELALMEDIEFSRRAKRLRAPACLKARVQTSSRRWEQGGVWRTIWQMMRLRWAYFLGADPAKLARRYHSEEAR